MARKIQPDEEAKVNVVSRRNFIAKIFAGACVPVEKVVDTGEALEVARCGEKNYGVTGAFFDE